MPNKIPAFLCFCLALSEGDVLANTLRVQVDGLGEYPTIQHAINAAAVGDTILIGPGIYTWNNQNTEDWGDTDRGMIQLLNSTENDPRAGTANDIVIKGETGRGQTILDAQRKGRVFYASGAQTAESSVAMRFTVEGLTFQNGLAQGDPSNLRGGGSATFLSTPTFRDCRFLDNEADWAGGALLGSQHKALFENCVFRGNKARLGAGALIINSSRNDSIFRNCRFESNVAETTAGGIFVVNARLEIEACSFILNTGTQRGSAIVTNLARPLIIRDCFIAGNEGAGSTLWAYYAVDPEWDGDPVPPTTSIEIYNTLLASNSATGIRFDADVNATVRCTNSFGHFDGDWRGNAAALVSVGGNGSFKPHLCGTNLRLREVCDLSPVLGINNNDCTSDMGLAVGNCTGCEIVDYLPDGAKTRALPAVPNPFSELTTIDYDLTRRSHVRITVYDLRGRVVRTLVDRVEDAGPHVAEWDGCDDAGDTVASGVYRCRFEAGDRRSSTPVLFLR